MFAVDHQTRINLSGEVLHPPLLKRGIFLILGVRQTVYLSSDYPTLCI
jgi:hypothetical protein